MSKFYKNHAVVFSAPGSTMLLGEHAVLYGHSAIACAVDQRISTACHYLSEPVLRIHSPSLGTLEMNWQQFKTMSPYDLITHKFRFVLTAVKLLCQQKSPGICIEITSDFSDQIGLGSSAAVAVTVIAGLTALRHHGIDKKLIYQTALHITRNIQGMASGTDIAVSIAGGIVHYRPDPFFVEKLSDHLSFHLIYSGYKTPTTQVVKKVNDDYHLSPGEYKQHFDHIEQCVRYGKSALLQQDITALATVFDTHQRIQQQLGVSDQTLNAMIRVLNQYDTIYGAKISGAGLGDSIIVLGHVNADIMDHLKKISDKIVLLPVQSGSIGLRDETKHRA
jgi:mevalonate kinase